eukprot:754406-Hanusia_phi.AAC.4
MRRGEGREGEKRRGGGEVLTEEEVEGSKRVTVRAERSCDRSFCSACTRWHQEQVEKGRKRRSGRGGASTEGRKKKRRRKSGLEAWRGGKKTR